MDDIENILNIARDEGLAVTTFNEAKVHGFDPCQYYIDRYPMDNTGNALDSENPIVDNIRFLEIINDIYNRLESIDLLNRKNAYRDYNTIFYGVGGDTKELIEEFIPDESKDIKYAGISIIDR